MVPPICQVSSIIMGPKEHICKKMIAYAAIGNAPELSCTELDSHANMAVMGKNCFVFDAVKGRHCDVQSFDLSKGSQTVPIVDAAVAYDCPYTCQTYILLV